MFKHLKDLQQNQQLQVSGDSRNHEYMNQLTSLKQVSGAQFASNVNGESLRDSQMHGLGNMQMMQQGVANVYQGLPTGFPGQNRGPSLSTHQFLTDVSGYGSLTSNSDKNLNLYSQLQGMANQSDNMLLKNNYKIFGASGVNPSGFASSFGGQQANFTSDQLNIGDGALLPNQMYQESNFFGQVPVQSLSNDMLSVNYANQRIRAQRDEDAAWNVASPLKPCNGNMPDADLDPLERKILYGTDNDNLGLLFGGGQFAQGDFLGKSGNSSYNDKFSSAQCGSWSALMQSAAADEDWSGLNLQSPDQAADNMPSNITKNEKHQNMWVDRNFQNASSSSSELQKPDGNYGFPSLQLSGHHFPKQDNESLHSSAHGLGRQFQSKQATGRTQMLQSISSSNGLPFQFDEAKGTLWKQGSASISGSSGVQDTLDQVNHMNTNRFPVESHKMVPGGTDDHMETNFLTSSALHGHNSNLQSRRMDELLNKNVLHNDVMHLNSRAQFSAMGNSGAASIQSPYMNDFVKNSSPQSPMATKFSGQAGPSSEVAFKQSSVPVDSQHALTLSASQQDMSSPKAQRLPSNFFRSNDSSSSRLEISSPSPNEQPSEKESSLNPFRMHNLIPLSSSVSQLPSHQADKKDVEVPSFPSGLRATGQPSDQNNPMFHQMLSSRDTGIDFGKKPGTSYDIVDYQQALATDFLSHGTPLGVEHNERNVPTELQGDHPSKVSASAENQVLQNPEMSRQMDSHSHSNSTNETSNGASASQVNMQVAPSWFKSFDTLTNPQPPTQLGTSKFQENDIQGNSAISRLANGVLLSSSSVLENSARNLDVPIAKKRKVVFELVPWHKEVKNDAPRLQNISIPELEWAHASNTKPEEAKIGAEITDDQPVFQAKRRLVFTTLLMQQVLRPAPLAILSADADLICDSVAYFSSRLVLGGLCNMKSKPPADAHDALKDTSKTLGITTDIDISRIAEELTNKVKKLEADLSRLDKSFSMAEVKTENQEAEKFSVINRFARFHMKAPQLAVDQSSAPKPYLQRYIMAYPMPKVIPEEIDCLSL